MQWIHKPSFDGFWNISNNKEEEMKKEMGDADIWDLI